WFDAAIAGDTIHVTSVEILIAKDLVIYNEWGAKVHIMSDVTGALQIAAGQNVELRNLDITSGVAGSPAAIDNLGDLILHDVDIYRNPGLSTDEVLLESEGQVTFRGACHIYQN
ncbi:MAG: hypothetical protein R3330_14685, partial [Saprospiraceae bacterium]|nr:hypothetical protein [Saprospiraceae bacterium]